jgi:predicted ATPase
MLSPPHRPEAQPSPGLLPHSLTPWRQKAALALYLGYHTSVFLMRELERISEEAIYEKRAFFIRNLGFITPTEARRISFEETAF